MYNHVELNLENTEVELSLAVKVGFMILALLIFAIIGASLGLFIAGPGMGFVGIAIGAAIGASVYAVCVGLVFAWNAFQEWRGPKLTVTMEDQVNSYKFLSVEEYQSRLGKQSNNSTSITQESSDYNSYSHPVYRIEAKPEDNNNNSNSCTIF